MLLQLNISNFALIESLNISFESGFNILSGETGAGKSIIIDAINYVLGVKFTKKLIRTGENKTIVEAVFSIENEKTKEILESLEITYDDTLIISREAFQSGKGIAKINNKTVLLSSLKEISETLIDIHGQHENQSLMNAENHIIFLDNYGESKLKEAKEKYILNYNKFKAIDEKIKEMSKKTEDRERKIDFYKFQIEEIENAKLVISEDSDLEEQYAIISNSEAISKALSDSYEKLYRGNENIASVFDTLGIVIKELRMVENHFGKIKNICDSIEEIYYNLEQNVFSIRDLKDGVEFDERELEEINNRIYTINSLKKKYGKTIEEILDYKDKIKEEYDELTNYSDTVSRLLLEKEKGLNIVIELALKLHHIRMKLAKNLEEKISSELKYIGLEKSIFKISVEVNTNEINENGADKVQFNISTNPGEPLKPLEKIVSGGELSRIMLAIKTVFVDKDKIPSVIFDEIDTGISGRTAQSVAEKMYLISNNHQVFCVTHLPQIACMSDTHYLVTKESSNNRTYTVISRLSKDGKEKALAVMIGGSDITKLTQEHAKEMIDLANKKKKILTLKNP